MPPKKTHKVHRDAGTGQFVTEKYADRHRKTTVRETVPNPPKKKQSPKKK
jgi:hypothetical protein